MSALPIIRGPCSDTPPVIKTTERGSLTCRLFLQYLQLNVPRQQQHSFFHSYSAHARDQQSAVFPSARLLLLPIRTAMLDNCSRNCPLLIALISHLECCQFHSVNDPRSPSGIIYFLRNSPRETPTRHSRYRKTKPNPAHDQRSSSRLP